MSCLVWRHMCLVDLTEQHGVAHPLLVKFLGAVSVVAGDDESEALHFLIIMMPTRTDLVLASDVTN